MIRLKRLLKHPASVSLILLLPVPSFAQLTLPYAGTYSGTGVTAFSVTNGGSGYSVSGINTSAGGYNNFGSLGGPTVGVYAISNNGWGVFSETYASTYPGVLGEVNSSDGAGYGLYGINLGMGTSGHQNFGFVGGQYLGVSGASYSATSGTIIGAGVYGNALDSTGYGVHGINTASTGSTGSAVGVYGASNNASVVNGVGVSGLSKSTTNGVGVLGQASSTSTTQTGYGAGIYGLGNASNWAGYFSGRVAVLDTLYAANGIGITGNLNVSGNITAGSKSFKIDHPLDPAHKYLVHSCIESDQIMNLYRGSVILNSDGKATVTMPSWFSALNTDFNYQLTCVGGYAPVFVSKEVEHNQFEVSGGKPGLKVCWEVTGTRQDAYAKAHPMQVEEAKSRSDQGKYLDPADYGKPKTDQIGYVAMPSPLHLVKPQTAGKSPAHRTQPTAR